MHVHVINYQVSVFFFLTFHKSLLQIRYCTAIENLLIFYSSQKLQNNLLSAVMKILKGKRVSLDCHLILK